MCHEAVSQDVRRENVLGDSLALGLLDDLLDGDDEFAAGILHHLAEVGRFGCRAVGIEGVADGAVLQKVTHSSGMHSKQGSDADEVVGVFGEEVEDLFPLLHP